METSDGTIDPQNEVRKLQELVKKLEKQNEVLRGKHGSKSSILDKQKQPTLPTDADSEEFIVGNRNNGSVSGSEVELDTVNLSKKKRENECALEDLDDVDHSILSVEEDSWLYTPPKDKTPQQSEDKLRTWVRQDFDHPSPEVESSRRYLLSRLDEVARMKHSSSTPVLGSQPYASRSATSLSRSTEETAATASRIGGGIGRGLPARKTGLAPPASQRNIDSGTFTRPKKATNGGAPMRGEGDFVDHHTNPNVEDIENLAKQQEESLRQSMTTPSSRSKGYRAKHDLADGDGARLSPSRFDLDGSYMSRHRDSLDSEHSTPPDSPQYSKQPQFNLSNSNDSRNRRNISGLSGLQYKMHNSSHHSSDSSLERHSNNSDEMNLAPEAMRTSSSRTMHQPNYQNHVPANSRRIAPPTQQMRGISPTPLTRGMSPQRQSGLPQPRRQIARPVTGTRTSLPTFRRNIPSAKPIPAQEPSTEDWRDGCF